MSGKNYVNNYYIENLTYIYGYGVSDLNGVASLVS